MSIINCTIYGLNTLAWRLAGDQPQSRPVALAGRTAVTTSSDAAPGEEEGSGRGGGGGRHRPGRAQQLHTIQ